MFAQWLRSALNRPGLSQRGLARHLGLESSQVSRMVQGKRRPQLDEIEQIAAYVGEYPPQIQSRTVAVATDIVVRGVIMERAWREAEASDSTGLSGLSPAVTDRVPGIPHPDYPFSVQYACELYEPIAPRTLERHYIIAVPAKTVLRPLAPNDWVHVYKSRDTLRLHGVRRLVRSPNGSLDAVDDKGLGEPLSAWTVAGLILGRTTIY